MINIRSINAKYIDNLGAIHLDCVIKRDSEEHRNAWIICVDGEYSIHKFVSSGDFTKEIMDYAKNHNLVIKDIK